MSALFNQTNIAPNTTNFITRQEVLLGLSTLAGDLSGVNFSTFFNQPNPVVSTLTVNPAGSITLPASVRAGNYVLSSISGLYPTQPYGSGGAINPGITNNTGATFAPLFAQSFTATNPANTVTSGDKLLYGANAITGVTAANVTQGFLGWNSGNPSGSQFVLANVSTINGIPPNVGQTTFTNLTGSNLTTTGMLTSPQIVNVSTINGSAYANVVQGTFTGSNAPSIPSGSATSVFSITVPAGTLKTNEAFLYDIPITMGAFPPAPINFQLLFGIRLGGNGQINYSLPYWIAANSVNPVPLNLTGIANTNQTSVSGQTVEVIVLQNSGSTWTAPFQAPPSAGGLNTFTLKLID
jgi:hypothetical protein